VKNAVNKARPTTAGAQFKNSVGELLKTLYTCQPHYIRTIKPNDDKRPLTFVDERVLEQVRYLGLLENLKVRRAGFCYRTDYARWLKRYGVISTKTFPTFSGDPREAVEILLNEAGVNSKDYIFGKTKLFVREPQALYVMEECRLKSFDRIAQIIKNSKAPPKLQTQGNVCLEYLRILIFEELSEFTIKKNAKRPEDKIYKHYQEIENDYASGTIEFNELKQNLYELLTSVVEPIREHFHKEKKSFWGFLKFFRGGKTSTSTLTQPK